MIRLSTTVGSGRRSSALSLGLLAAVSGAAALLAGLTLVPGPAKSSPAVPAATTEAQHRASAPVQAASEAARASSDEPRRAVRVVYSGPITR